MAVEIDMVLGDGERCGRRPASQSTETGQNERIAWRVVNRRFLEGHGTTQTDIEVGRFAFGFEA